MKGFAAVLCVGVVGGGGCAGEPRAPEPEVVSRPPEMSTAWQSAPLPTNAQPTAVKMGAASLVYRVESGAVIRVREQNSERDLARGFVPAGSLVRVDGRRGVIFGEDTVFAGPLAEGERYVIVVEPGGENVARQGVIQPRARHAR